MLLLLLRLVGPWGSAAISQPEIGVRRRCCRPQHARGTQFRLCSESGMLNPRVRMGGSCRADFLTVNFSTIGTQQELTVQGKNTAAFQTIHFRRHGD